MEVGIDDTTNKLHAIATMDNSNSQVAQLNLDDIDAEAASSILDELLKALKSLNENVASEQLIGNYSQFIHSWCRDYEEFEVKEWNLLYALSTQRSLPQNGPWLIKLLAEKLPQLLHDKDKSTNNLSALLTAVSQKRIEFITALLDSNVDPEHLARAIDEADTSKENSLHKAIKGELNSAITIQLVEKASKQAFIAQDMDGNTPIHCAVHYQNCTSSRSDMIHTLIKRSDGAFDLKSGKPDCFSVYQYFASTKKDYLKSTSNTQTASTDLNGAQSDNQTDASNEEFAIRDPKKLDTNTVVRHPARQYHANESRLVRQNSNTTSQVQFAPASKPRDKTRKSAHSNIKKEPPCEKVANSIDKELKLQYFRSIFQQVRDFYNGNGSSSSNQTIRTHDSAVDFLFGDNKEDIYIRFDFPAELYEKMKPVSFEDFKKCYANFKFNDVLLHVNFGQVELETVSSKPNSKTKADEGAGRRDIAHFFDWLSEQQVKNIVKVTVDDRNSVPHSDEVIENALKRFSIDILEWKKIDLDPRVIQVACEASGTNLHELHLWWSGNNAILRAWSEPEGLGKLKGLQRIHIHEEQNGLDSTLRSLENIKQFKDRLIKNKAYDTRIEVTHHKPGNRRIPGHVAPPIDTDVKTATHIDTHRWLEIMDKFAEGINSLQPPDDPKLPIALKKEVTVALIDDGVSVMNEAIAERIDKGRTFLAKTGQFHGSTTGHGTWMAYMIARVCPAVKIYVCKLDVIRQGDKAVFTAESAAQAVKFAAGRKFDIISISWTVQKSDDSKNARHIEQLEEALNLAAKNCLVFCSAPDIGESNDAILRKYYPFGYENIASRIFKIGAARADGRGYGWVGNHQKIDFLLPGHEVDLRPGDTIDINKDAPRTGSSVATALAAGLGALIIHCVRLGAIYHFIHKKPDDPNAVNEKSLRDIKKSTNMRQALTKMKSWKAIDTEFGKILEVENFFGDASKIISADNEAEDNVKWEAIARLARDLAPQITRRKSHSEATENTVHSDI